MHSIRWAFNCSLWDPSDSEWHAACTLLNDPVELARINAFRFKSDAKLALIGRLLMLASYSHTAALPQPASPSFGRDSRTGKPFLRVAPDSLAPDPRFQFNVSHHGDFAVIAAHWAPRPIGVDVMRVETPRNEPVDAFIQVMRSSLSESEYADVTRVDSSPWEKLCRFYRLWTLKESYIKATGEGLATELSGVTFTAWDASTQHKTVTRTSLSACPGSAESPSVLSGWSFEQSCLSADHLVAVAVGPRIPGVPNAPESNDNDSLPLRLEELQFTVIDSFARLHAMLERPA